jgi:hypothetical protein
MLHAECRVPAHRVLDSDCLLTDTYYFEFLRVLFSNIICRLSGQSNPSLYIGSQHQLQNRTVATNNVDQIYSKTGKITFEFVTTLSTQFHPYINVHSKNLSHYNYFVFATKTCVKVENLYFTHSFPHTNKNIGCSEPGMFWRLVYVPKLADRNKSYIVQLSSRSSVKYELHLRNTFIHARNNNTLLKMIFYAAI